MYTAKDARNTVIDYERNRNQEELEFLLDITDNRIAYDIVIEEIKSLAYKGVSEMLIEKKNKRDAELISLFIETNFEILIGSTMLTLTREEWMHINDMVERSMGFLDQIQHLES